MEGLTRFKHKPSTRPCPRLEMTISTIICKGVLSDMDGTLIDSTPSVEEVYLDVCKRFDLDYDRESPLLCSVQACLT